MFIEHLLYAWSVPALCLWGSGAGRGDVEGQAQGKSLPLLCPGHLLQGKGLEWGTLGTEALSGPNSGLGAGVVGVGRNGKEGALEEPSLKIQVPALYGFR